MKYNLTFPINQILPKIDRMKYEAQILSYKNFLLLFYQITFFIHLYRFIWFFHCPVWHWLGELDCRYVCLSGCSSCMYEEATTIDSTLLTQYFTIQHYITYRIRLVHYFTINGIRKHYLTSIKYSITLIQKLFVVKKIVYMRCLEPKWIKDRKKGYLFTI